MTAPVIARRPSALQAFRIAQGELIEWDRAIVLEDREALESTSPDAILDVSRRIEQHMPSDRPGLIMRRRLLEFLRSQGEEEITRSYA